MSLPSPSNGVPAEGESISPRAKVGDYVIKDRGYETPCWIWQRFKDRFGYGKLSPGTAAEDQRAHREYWRLANGPIPPGHHVHHRCKTTSCVNPEHLQLLTARQHFLEHKLYEKTGLTLADIIDIRRLSREPGMTAKMVADRYGIHEITVYNYWGQEQVWADLLDDEPVEKPTRVCPQCGEEFNHRKRDAVYCCREHRILFNNRKRAAA